MLKYLKFFLISLLALGLFACLPQKNDYVTLMLHPDHLQRVYNQCVGSIENPALPCETIMRAQADFTVLENQRDQDPENFGARILEAQEAYVFLRAKYHDTLTVYHALGKDEHSVEELKNERIKLEKIRAEYETSRIKVEILLAVIAATSSI